MMGPGFYLMDCMAAMREFPDKFFDLAVVDPPYGDGNAEIGGGARFGQRFDRYKQDSGKQLINAAKTPAGGVPQPGY